MRDNGFRLAVTLGGHAVRRCGNGRGCGTVRWSHPIEGGERCLCWWSLKSAVPNGKLTTIGAGEPTAPP